MTSNTKTAEARIEAGGIVSSNNSNSETMPYDQYLLERVVTQWQFGDWESLYALDEESLKYHPDRAKLALFAAAARLQRGIEEDGRSFLKLAREWGCSKKDIAKMLAACVHDHMAKANLLINRGERAQIHLERALSTGTPGCETRLLTQGRLSQSISQLEQHGVKLRFSVIKSQKKDCENLEVPIAVLNQKDCIEFCLISDDLFDHVDQKLASSDYLESDKVGFLLSISDVYIKNGAGEIALKLLRKIINFGLVVDDANKKVFIAQITLLSNRKLATELIQDRRKMQFARRKIGRTSISLDSVKTIVIIRLDNIGDHVLGGALLKGLRGFYQQAEIVVVSGQMARGYYEHCPWIDRVVELPNRDNSLYSPEQLSLIRTILENEFSYPVDLLINPRFAEDYYHACVISTYIKSRAKVGFWQDRTPLDGIDPNDFYTEIVRVEYDDLHTAEYSNLMLSFLGAEAKGGVPEVWYSLGDKLQMVEKIKEQLSVAHLNKIVVVGIGASSKNRLWPKENYVGLINILSVRFPDLVFCLVGSSSDRDVSEFILRMAPSAINLVGSTTLSQLAALCSASFVYIGPDSGPKHVAAAAGCPVLEIGHVPANRRSKARSHDTAGKCWSAFNVISRTVSPNPSFSEGQISKGVSIASLTANVVADAFCEFVEIVELYDYFRKSAPEVLVT